MVMGPYDAGDWLTMKMLKEAVAYMKAKDPVKYSVSIAKEKSLLQDFIKKVA